MQDQYKARYAGGMLRLMTNDLPDIRDGEIVAVEIERDRSIKSHRHQFAWVKDAWDNLPESVMFEPWAATPETLRKHALVKTGYFEQVVIDCGSDKMAREVAAAIATSRKKSEGYAHAVVRNGVAIVRWPQSQSRKAMGGDSFKASKTAILEWIADLIGVTPGELIGVAA